MTDVPITTRVAASGRFDVLRDPEPGAASWVHRWMGDDFPHKRGDGSAYCTCKPYYVPAGDTRSLDEIADDMEEEADAIN